MRIIFLILVSSFYCQVGYGQSCQEVNLFDSKSKKEIVKDYINSSLKGHYFIEDKGIVTIVVYRDGSGHTCWYLSSLIDNRFLKNPPTQYTWLGNDIVLVYQGDATGKIIVQTPASNDLVHCLSELIGGRVYDYTPKPQFTYITDANGKKEKWRVKHDENGNVHNDIIIIFNDDGTITKKIPA